MCSISSKHLASISQLSSVLCPPLQERHVALHSEGVKMVVDSEQPHFVGVDPDILSTGLVFYYLKVSRLVCKASGFHHTCTHTHTHTHTHMHTHTHTCTCAHTCIHTYAYIHTCMHTHTQIITHNYPCCTTVFCLCVCPIFLNTMTREFSYFKTQYYR